MVQIWDDYSLIVLYFWIVCSLANILAFIAMLFVDAGERIDTEVIVGALFCFGLFGPPLTALLLIASTVDLISNQLETGKQIAEKHNERKRNERS